MSYEHDDEREYEVYGYEDSGKHTEGLVRNMMYDPRQQTIIKTQRDIIHLELTLDDVNHDVDEHSDTSV